MHALSNKQVREIADQLDCGFRCFWNKETNDFVFVPDVLKHQDIDESAWREENYQLENNWDKFREIESLDTSDSFRIMEDFVQQLPDKVPVKSQLTQALGQSKPFRHFKSTIDHSGEFRQKWFDFKRRWIEQWVIDRFNAMVDGEQ